MLRRFLLVGVMVVVESGSVLQVLLGTLISILFLSVQFAVMPFRYTGNNFIASISSLCQVAFFLCASAFKYTSLTDTEDVALKMSDEQHEIYVYDTVLLTLLMFASLIITVTIVAVLFCYSAIGSGWNVINDTGTLRRRKLQNRLRRELNRPLGSEWKDAGSEKPELGKEIVCEPLKSALREYQNFSQPEIDAFKIQNLRMDSFIRVDDKYFVQAADDTTRRDLLVKALKMMDEPVESSLCSINLSAELAAAELAAARSIYASDGLHPKYWGISKAQLKVFRDEVREALRCGGMQAALEREAFGSCPAMWLISPAANPSAHLSRYHQPIRPRFIAPLLLRTVQV